ncbi:MAG TPA: hypothetical protein PL196_01350, partial [Burkholderiaceae bacterium]|nr:hypothetical protein [Burkholderiaceae bacterium]
MSYAASSETPDPVVEERLRESPALAAWASRAASLSVPEATDLLQAVGSFPRVVAVFEDALLAIAKDESRSLDLRLTAFAALDRGAFLSSSTRRAIAQMAIGQNSPTGDAATALLVAWSPFPTDLIPEVTTGLQSSAPAVRVRALRVLGAAGPSARPHLAAIASASIDSDRSVATMAEQTFRAVAGHTRVSPEDLRSVVERLEGGDPNDSLHAACLLAPYLDDPDGTWTGK